MNFKTCCKTRSKNNKNNSNNKLKFKIMEATTGIKFYQVLVTNWHDGTEDCMCKYVFNYATLADALKCPFYIGDENKRVKDGEKWVDGFTGVEKYQYHFTYTDQQGRATIALRHEKIEHDERGQHVSIYQVLIREIIL